MNATHNAAFVPVLVDQPTLEELNAKLYNPWHPDASRKTTHELAHATPTRVVEMQKPGPATMFDMTDGTSVRKPRAAKRRQHAPVKARQITKRNAAPAKKAAKPAPQKPAGKKVLETLSKSAAKKLEQKKQVYSALYAFNAHVAVLKQGGLSHRDAVAQAADDRKAGLI